MRKVFTLLLFTVLATIGMRAKEGNATVSFSSTEDGKVLTITGGGDLSTISGENKTFVQMLEAKMKSGSYEKIVFVKADGAESLIITPEIANTLVYPNSAPYSSLKELDLRATTITTFENSFNPADYVNVPSVLRLPSATNTPIASGHMNYNKLTGLSLLDVSSLNLTNEQVGFFISNNNGKVINVIDINDLTESSLAARWRVNYSFNVFSPKTPSAGNPTEINVYVKNVSSLDLKNNASGYVNVVLSADQGTVNDQNTMTTLMQKVNEITGITNLILAKVGLYNSMNFNLSALTNTSVVRIILPDYQKIEEITNALHNPILQVYNTKYIGFGTGSGNVEIIKVTNSGDLAKISNAHYYSEDINNAYWQEYQGTLNADDMKFLQGINNDRLNLSKAKFADGGNKWHETFSNDNIEYLAWPDLGEKPSDPLYKALFTHCQKLVAVGQYIKNETKLYVNTKEAGNVKYVTELLSETTNENRSIKYAKISGPLKAEDIFASGCEAKIDADGHAYFSTLDEYSADKRTMGPKEGGNKLTSGALNNISLIGLDLSDATFDHIDDMTLSSMNILGSTTREVIIPTAASVTEIPADFLNYDGNKIEKICIPGNIKKIHARAFKTALLKYIWTTGDDADVKYDNGAKYLLKDNTTLSDTYEDGATMKYGTFTFSPNLEFIGSYAFGSSENVHDVYMLGRKAPVCLVDAFSTVSYVANNSYMTFDGTVNREAYKNKEYAFMTVLHFPSTCTDAEAKLYTDITREYSIASDEMDDKGKTVYYPTQAEWNRSFVQGTTGYLWNAYCAKRNGTGAAQAFYESSNSEIGINISYETGKLQTKYQTESNELYGKNDYANKSKSVFYDTDVTDTEASESLEYDRTLYANDYRGWHQFVLTSYTSTRTIPTYSKDFSDFSDNEWWTICEPFPLTAGELKQVFGDGVKLVKLISVTRDVANQKITLNFGNNLVSGKNDDEYTLEAGVPYLIKPALEKGWTVDSRLLTYAQSDEANDASRFAPKTAEELQTILEKGKYTVDAIVKNNTPENPEPTEPKDGKQIHTKLKYTMLGTFYLHYLPKHCYFLGWDNKNSCVTFYWKGNDANPAELSWNPYTAVIVPNFINEGFYVPNGTFETVHYNYNNNCIGMTDDYNGTNSSKRMSLEFFLEEDNGTVTGIDDIRSDSQDLYNDDIYNISGQLVRRKGDMSNLTKGLYIVNGKKYIVK